MGGFGIDAQLTTYAETTLLHLIQLPTTAVAFLAFGDNWLGSFILYGDHSSRQRVDKFTYSRSQVWLLRLFGQMRNLRFRKKDRSQRSPEREESDI